MYKENDVVLVCYLTCKVARRLSKEEADDLNRGVFPVEWLGDVTHVERPKGKTHYYTPCGGRDVVGTARNLQATTCLRCLKERAKDLRGWRWTHGINAEDVAYLKEVLGDKVAGYEKEPS